MVLTGIRSQDRPARSELLHRVSNRSPHLFNTDYKIISTSTFNSVKRWKFLKCQNVIRVRSFYKIRNNTESYSEQINWQILETSWLFCDLLLCLVLHI